MAESRVQSQTRFWFYIPAYQLYDIYHLCALLFCSFAVFPHSLHFLSSSLKIIIWLIYREGLCGWSSKSSATEHKRSVDFLLLSHLSRVHQPVRVHLYFFTVDSKGKAYLRCFPWIPADGEDEQVLGMQSRAVTVTIWNAHCS